MITNISTGNYNVIESNVVYLYNNDSDLVLNFEFGAFKFNVKFIFVDNDNIEKKLQSRIDGDTINFKCTNFYNEFGTGTTQPLEIATIENKKAYIQFWVFGHGEPPKGAFVRKVEYTIFIER